MKVERMVHHAACTEEATIDDDAAPLWISCCSIVVLWSKHARKTCSPSGDRRYLDVLCTYVTVLQIAPN